MSTTTQEDSARAATRRPTLDEARRRVVEITVDLDAARGGLAAVRDELPSRPPEEAVDELGPKTCEDDLYGVIEDAIPDLADIVGSLRGVAERTESDLASVRAKEAAAQAVAETYVLYRRFADASKTLSSTAEAICTRLLDRQVPSAAAVAAVEEGVENLGAILRAQAPAPANLEGAVP